MKDIYVSRGWRPADLPFADSICVALCERKWMLRLIGDSPDQNSFSAERIRDILSDCGGHLLILPRRDETGAPGEHEFRYFIRELAISKELGIPSVIIAETGALLPNSLSAEAARVASADNLRASWLLDPPDWLEKFLEDLRRPPAPRHLFLAAEFRDNLERVGRIREMIESVGGLPCWIGLDFEGQSLRDQITRSVASSTMVFANLATIDDSGAMKVNENTCVEAGIATGASAARAQNGQKPLPIFIMAQCAADEKERTKKLPFMFRDSQITWYSTEVELLGHIRRLLHPHRRRVMNFEFARTY